MSDMAYGWTYFGLNLASFVGQAAGNIYNLKKTREPRLGYDGELNGYRYKTKNGKMFDFDYPHNNIRINHFHGWNGPGLTGRTSRTTLELFKIDMVANIREVIYEYPVY